MNLKGSSGEKTSWSNIEENKKWWKNLFKFWKKLFPFSSYCSFSFLDIFYGVSLNYVSQNAPKKCWLTLFKDVTRVNKKNTKKHIPNGIIHSPQAPIIFADSAVTAEPLLGICCNFVHILMQLKGNSIPNFNFSRHQVQQLWQCQHNL